jgi:hypothetical protein
VISTLSIIKDAESKIIPYLDYKPVTRISAFLLDSYSDDTPIALRANFNKSFFGVKISGDGFLFEEDTPGSSIFSGLNDIILKEPGSKAIIAPYVGAEQLNNQPVFQPVRMVINFGEMSLYDASKHRTLFERVENLVKPERIKLDPAVYKRRATEWWKFSDPCLALQKALIGLPRVLVTNCSAAKHLLFAFLPPGLVYSNSLYVFADQTFQHFAVLQSRIHELWARMFGTSMRDDLRYTGTTCYENYPFPEFTQSLGAVGESYSQTRSAVMLALNVGLTKLSNQLNSPDYKSADIINLRELHAAMDKAVLEAYGWGDIINLKSYDEIYEFSGDYENEDGSLGSVRLNFTEEVRDEILRRLLALHAERFKAEQDQPKPEVKKISKPKPKKPKPPSGAGQSELF